MKSQTDLQVSCVKKWINSTCQVGQSYKSGQKILAADAFFAENCDKICEMDWNPTEHEKCYDN